MFSCHIGWILIVTALTDSDEGMSPMDENEWLVRRFEENRAHLRAVAYRMLGASSEADDAVQEAWLRLSRSETARIDNLSGWLTTVVARVSLDMLRTRASRREDPSASVPEATSPRDRSGTIVGRSSAAVRQLASRARRRVHGGSPVGDADVARQRNVVEAFLGAARRGDF